MPANTGGILQRRFIFLSPWAGQSVDSDGEILE